MKYSCHIVVQGRVTVLLTSVEDLPSVPTRGHIAFCHKYLLRDFAHTA